MSEQYSDIHLPPLHPKQQLAFNTTATEILYGGATRAGKSFLVRWAYIMWAAEIPGFQADIFRLHYDDVIGNHMEGENSFPEMLAPWEKAGLVDIIKTEIRFKFNGSLISLEHCASDKVLRKHQGIPKHCRCIEEATQIKEEHIMWLRSWVTMTVDMKEALPEKYKGQFPKMLYPTNPIGVSSGYFRRNFVNARPAMEIEKVGAFNRIYIPAIVEDNPSEDAEATRERWAEHDPALADAMLNANWDALVGDYIRQWNRELHYVPDFMPPAHWFKYRAFDWGSSDPFCVLWFCVSDGEEFQDQQDRKRWFPRGATIVYREWYGCNPDKPAKGCELPNVDIARGILERTTEVTSNITLTDSMPFNNYGGEIMAETFARLGVPLTRANTQRIAGWKKVKDDLNGKDGFPMAYVCHQARYLAEYLPMLQRHPSKVEDAQEDGEATHVCDTFRYGLMTFSQIRKAPPSVQSPRFEQASTMTPRTIIQDLSARKKVGRR